MITFVSSFVLLPSSKHSIDEYKVNFEKLVVLAIPIVLFLDRKVDWCFRDNVTIIPISLEDTWVGKNVPENVELPSTRSEVDTREYMMIQNAKTEFVLQAARTNPFHTEWFAWIDFGIGHVFREASQTLDRIRALVPPISPCVRTAGIWRHTPSDLFDKVCWRFAGGFFLIHRSRISDFHNAVKTSIQRNLPQFAWEVNVWADVERYGIDLGWFQADHNDSIIPFT
jgi:hypothetical protein